ncbi:hypothetical protein E2C01_046542 [Portunus trituberculatus]|uniref:Uncharacterized protein n=1 Tax=Portunus trituberculatus TaxID=210409 RepID=A0A5B7G553_PORTR|nr:hypothetical protein [Portunus trituberculatus]
MRPPKTRLQQRQGVGYGTADWPIRLAHRLLVQLQIWVALLFSCSAMLWVISFSLTRQAKKILNKWYNTNVTTVEDNDIVLFFYRAFYSSAHKQEE